MTIIGDIRKETKASEAPGFAIGLALHRQAVDRQRQFRRRSGQPEPARPDPNRESRAVARVLRDRPVGPSAVIAGLPREYPMGPGAVTSPPRVAIADLTSYRAPAERSVPYWNPRLPGDVDPHDVGGPMGPGGVMAQPNLVDMSTRATGVPSIYARALFAQEGGDNPEAQNPRSTARGLTQFIESTWLSMMRQHGERYGLPAELVRSRTREAERQILELRNSPQWNAIMSGHYAQQEHAAMVRRAGRPVSVAETYLAHFMNGDVAGQWVRAADREPNLNARTLLRRIYANNPRQADLIIEQNPGVFSENATAFSVYRRQTQDFSAHGVRRLVASEQAERGVPFTATERRAREEQIKRQFEQVWPTVRKSVRYGERG